MAILVLACLMSCLIGLYRLQTSQYAKTQATIWSLKTDTLQILKLMGLATPFFIILFLFFPRFPPLWQIPVANHTAVTGVNDRMSPGDIAQLSQSTALAFRITGNMQQLPNRNLLYWRGMVLDQYDGKTWTSHFSNQHIRFVPNKGDGSVDFSYQYLAADPKRRWLMTLEKSIPVNERYILHQDWSVTARRSVQQNQPITFKWLRHSTELSLSRPSNKFEQDLNVSYPRLNDPKSQKMAQDLFKQSQSNPQVYVSQVIDWYKKNKFSYTLSPGKMGQNSIDEFLFGSKKGFCEHYASSFVMLMRYVGIPARVVVGYQGGQLAPDGQSWEVRQLDAHAWAEVYLDQTWQRIDPTAVIAPQRIDQGMQNLLAGDPQVLGNETFSSIRYQQFSALKSLRIWSDYLSYQWQSKVVGYDAEKQNNWLKKLGFNSNYYSIILIFLSILCIVGIYFFIQFFLAKRKKSWLECEIQKFNTKLTPDDQREMDETFQSWMKRLALKTQNAHVFEQTNIVFQKIMYLKQENKDLRQQFSQLLKECASDLKKVKKTCHLAKK